MTDRFYVERGTRSLQADRIDEAFSSSHVQIPPRDPVVSTGPGVPATGAWAPTSDVYELDNAVTIEIELPGLSAEQIRVDAILADDMETAASTLIVSGRIDEQHKSGRCIAQERRTGDFQRSFSLPEGYVCARTEVMFAGGLLTMTIPHEPAVEMPMTSQRVLHLEVPSPGDELSSPGETSNSRDREDSDLTASSGGCPKSP
jgi:HSP20 family molecular chaperone IbpA